MRPLKRKRGISISYYLLPAAAAIFIWIIGRTLPDIVASHFNAAGQADGFMPRMIYQCFMYTIIVFVPLVLMTFPARAFRHPNARINIPNRDYWLAPVRREQTIEFLAKQPPRFAVLLLIFLCYVYWLVARANQQPFPMLPAREFLGGLIAFLLAVLLWAVAFIGHFRRVPRA